jgi:hypothetical protein
MNLESIVGVLKGLKGRTTDMVYDLFFTERRVIAAIVLHPSDFAGQYGKPDPTTLVMGGYFKQREIKVQSLKLMDERRSALEGKTADEVLASHKNNAEIEYENVTSVRIKKGIFGTSLEFVVQNPPGKKINFSLDGAQVGEAEGLMKKVLPDRAR